MGLTSYTLARSGIVQRFRLAALRGFLRFAWNREKTYDGKTEIPHIDTRRGEGKRVLILFCQGFEVINLYFG